VMGGGKRSGDRLVAALIAVAVAVLDFPRFHGHPISY